MSGIYLHIPFCHSKCAYCDFYSMGSAQKVNMLPLMSRLANAMGHEYKMRSHELGTSSLETVYVGGGTPSIMPMDLMASIVESLSLGSVREFTIEANPEDINMEALHCWRAMGINRISMGVQSLFDSELQLIGRRHTAQQAIDAIEQIKAAGFDNFSVDLIYGLPTQSLSSWEHSLRTALSMHPSHISAYMLSYEPRTKLTQMLQHGTIAETDDDILISMYRMLNDYTRDYGYEHYEISNFALPGHRALHNSNYWKSLPYLGLGPSAHSYDGMVRRVNPSNILRYLKDIETGNCAFKVEAEDEDNKINDRIMVALRTAEGFDLSSLDPHRREILLCEAQPWLTSGTLKRDGDRIFIPENEWMMSDAVISSLLFVD